MILKAMYRGLLAPTILCGAIACTEPKATTGPDQRSGSTVTETTWTDGKPAYSITCDLPQSCQQRALALCKGGNYAVLKSENMPISAGNARYVSDKPSTVIRCN